MRSRWAVVMLALLCAACGSKVKSDVEDARPPTTAASVPAAKTSSGAGPSSAGREAPVSAQGTKLGAGPKPAPGASVQPTTSTTMPTRPANSGVNDRLPLSATITPACAKRGEVVTVDVTTRPYGSIATMVNYSDRKAHTPGTIGSADREGKWSWIITVPANASYGAARVDVLVEDRTPTADGESASTNNDNAHGVYQFEVAKSC